MKTRTANILDSTARNLGNQNCSDSLMNCSSFGNRKTKPKLLLPDTRKLGVKFSSLNLSEQNENESSYPHAIKSGKNCDAFESDESARRS
jgi:hypothetical protein